MQRNLLILGIFFLAVVVVVAIFIARNKEDFKHVAIAAQLQDGLYRIANPSGIPLTSNIIDTVSCKDFLIGEQHPSKDLDWKLKRVAEGVYIFYKQGERECLFAHPTNTPRSFFFPTCDTKNLCGLEEPNHLGELDTDSLRSYFMVLQHPNGQFYIKNMKNDMYLEMTPKALRFVKNPTKHCLFTFQQV